MISSSSRIATGSFTAAADAYGICRNGMRLSNRMRNRDCRAASCGKADGEKQHFYGSPGE
ncbi:MAG: hypothetical protein ICV83_31155 [Cytophagales bacterium]|nr:hypothetical protein [Cytophagales bacterium]